MHLENVNLNLLVPLDVLLRTRNVTHAGRELSLSQSATSEVLAKLRRTLRDPLLVRRGRSLVLTPYAEAVQDQLSEALRLIDQLMTERPEFDAKVDRREFTVVASDYVATILRPVVTGLTDVAPHITITFQPLRDDFDDRIRRDDADLVLVSEGVRRDRLDSMPREEIFTDRFMLCGWRDNPVLAEPVTRQRFCELPYVQYRTGRRPSLADQALEELQIRPNVQVRTESPLLVPFLLQSSPLIALVPQRLAELLQETAALTILEPPVRLPQIEQSAVWHPRRTLDPAHAWLRNRIGSRVLR